MMSYNVENNSQAFLNDLANNEFGVNINVAPDCLKLVKQE